MKGQVGNRQRARQHGAQKLNQAQVVADTRSSGGAQGELARQTRIVQGQAFYFNNGAWVDAAVQDQGRQPPGASPSPRPSTFRC